MVCNLQILHAQCGGGPGQCLGTQSYTANPAPVNGQYANGQVVTFCYTIQDYNQCNSNWLHTIDLKLGQGWDATTLSPAGLPLSCDAMGEWGYYLSSTSVNTGLTFGPCFAYDSPSGSPGGILDGNPGNNYGDNCTTYTWTFCFSIQVALGCNNQSLNIDATAIGDATGGSWTIDVCPGVSFNICNATCSSCKLAVTETTVNPTCADNNGSITLSADSAIGGVSYSWSPGGQITQTISGLSSGTYICTVTDSFGCEVSDTCTLSFINGVQVTSTKTNAQCYGYCNGSGYIFPLGGILPYTYSWSNGQTGSYDTALCAGTYYFTVTDSNSCSITDTIIIDEPDRIELSTTQVDATCFGNNDASSTVITTGGSGTYFYFWQPSNQLGSTASNLGAGTYSIVVTDTKGCTADTFVTILSPAQIQTGFTITDASCFGYSDGAIITNVSNGVPPYQYQWSNSGLTGTSCPDAVAGVYILLVTDANGCAQLDSFTVAQPDMLTGTLDIVPASCTEAMNGSIQMYATGGTSPYAYEWNSNPSLNQSGLYSQSEGVNGVQVTDYNGCTYAITDIIPVLNDLFAFAGKDTFIELGTAALLKATASRDGIFRYAWSPGYHLVDSTEAITEANPYYTITYIVKITEISSGCHDRDSVAVRILPADYVIFPNAFSPNGDGVNDVFLPVAGNLIEIEKFVIINRWGSVVFDDKTRGWDGTFAGVPEELGAYVYKVTYKVEGRTDLYARTGTVTLLR